MIVSGGQCPIRAAGETERWSGRREGSHGPAAAAPEEWTSLFSRLWWKRFSRIAVNR